MSIIVLSLVAAAGFWLSTLLVATALGRSRSFHHFSVVIAAGILLGVTIADLIPEAFELAEGTDAAFAIVGGFLALYLVEALTRGHTHHHEPHAAHVDAEIAENEGAGGSHAHAHTHAPAGSTINEQGELCVPTHAVMPFLLGLGLHNLADGVVIGASNQSSDSAATGVAVGILVHQLPVGLSFAAVLLASGLALGRMRLHAALIAAMIPIGGLIVVLAPNLTDHTVGLLVGAAAGALLYIATGHLLPEAHSEHPRPALAAAFTTAIVGTVLFVGATHDATHSDHGHAEDESAHADEEADEHADEDEEEHADEAVDEDADEHADEPAA